MVFDSGFKSLKVCQPSSGCRGAYFGSIRDIRFRDLKLAFILRIWAFGSEGLGV